MRKLLLCLALLCATPLLAQNKQGQGSIGDQAVAPQDQRAIFTALSATGATPALSLVGNPGKPGGVNPSTAYVYAPKFLAIFSPTTGTPATCTYTVFATLKFPIENPVFPADYQAISTSQTCGTPFFMTYVPASQIVLSLTALTGGTAPTVSFQVLAVH